MTPNDHDPLPFAEYFPPEKPEPPKPIVAYEHSGSERAFPPVLYVIVVLGILLVCSLYGLYRSVHATRADYVLCQQQQQTTQVDKVCPR